MTIKADSNDVEYMGRCSFLLYLSDGAEVRRINGAAEGVLFVAVIFLFIVLSFISGVQLFCIFWRRLASLVYYVLICLFHQMLLEFSDECINLLRSTRQQKNEFS